MTKAGEGSRRISIVGSSGAGKSTLARTLEARLGLRRLELDSVQHQPNWTPCEPDTFRAVVRDFVAGPSWVVDGNYTRVGALDLVWERAELAVWLDLPHALKTARIIRRSARRVLRREALWNGNRERLRELVSLDPERNFILWAHGNHPHVRQKYEARFADPRWAGLAKVRLRSPAEVRAWVSQLPR